MRRALLALLALASCAPIASPIPAAAPPIDQAAAAGEVARELDDLHDAAAHADEARYFAHFAPHGVFLGTDATERWDTPAFRAYAHPRFAEGSGWEYHSTRRTIAVSGGDGGIAWFDEDLRSPKYGPMRGSGVLVRFHGRWLVAQYNLAVTIPNERFAAVLAARDAPPAPPELRARYRDAYQAATAAAAKGDLAGARGLLSALVAEAKTRPDDDLEFWLHNELTWVRWAEGDLPGARAEVEAARATLDHAALPADKSRALRLHERWDRAYLALEAAMKAPPAARAGALAEAERARADYDALATAAHDHDGQAVLATFFALRKGSARAAATEAKRVDAARDADLQDLYVLALAFDAAGDHGAAEALRARICAGGDHLMKPLIVRAMAAEGRACAPR